MCVLSLSVNQAALQYTQFATCTRNITNNLFYTPLKKSRQSAYLQIPGFLILFYFTLVPDTIKHSTGGSFINQMIDTIKDTKIQIIIIARQMPATIFICFDFLFLIFSSMPVV